MQHLLESIPAQARKVFYAVYAVIGVVLGATQTVYITLETGQPTWLTAALAVFSYVGIAFGVLASSNTVAPTATVKSKEEARHADLSG